MYMRGPPTSLAPAGIPGATSQTNSGTGMPGITNHSVRFYELLDALKMEYDLSVQQSSGLLDATNKMSQSDYETKGNRQLQISKGIFYLILSIVQLQTNELSHMQKTILELERAFYKMKQE